MDRLELAWDPKNGHFWAEVGIALSDGMQRAGDTFGQFVIEKLIVDTGSNRSGIAETVAKQIGVEIGKLPYEDVHGISGAVSHHMADNIVFWFLVGEPRPVQLQRIIVIPRMRKRVETRKPGKYAYRGKPFGPSLSILGLDAIEALEGTLMIDLDSKRGHIQW